jgi:hypothetical protein
MLRALFCVVVAVALALLVPAALRDKPTCICIGDDCAKDPCKMYGWDPVTGKLTKGALKTPD